MSGTINNQGPQQPQSLPTSEDNNDRVATTNLLLILTSGTDKRVKDLERTADAVIVSQSEQATAEEVEQFANLAKALINDPTLPPGDKAALQRWLNVLQSFPTTTTLPQNAQVTAGQTTQRLHLPTGDPQTLLVPANITNQEIVDLGKMASTIARSQNGTLTPEAKSALLAEVNDMLQMPDLSPDERQALLTLRSTISNFPSSKPTSTTPENTDPTTPQEVITSDPDAPATLKTMAEVLTPENEAAAETLSNEPPPDPGSLAVTTNNQNIKNLSLSAQNLATANGGPLTGGQLTDLLAQANTLLQNPNLSDADKTQLMNFIATLNNYPAMKGLAMNIPGADPDLIQLGQFAEALAEANGGAITPDELAQLQQMVEDLMPQLDSPEDKQILKTWTNVLVNYKMQIPTAQTTLGEALMFGTTMGGHNPWMDPGVMALLAPILAELTKLYNDIIRQSSKLKQQMMALTTAMAKEAYNAAIAAGEAKSQQLRNDADKFMALAICSGVQAGMSMVNIGMSMKMQSKMGNEYDALQKEKFAADPKNVGKSPAQLDADFDTFKGTADYKLSRMGEVQRQFQNSGYAQVGGILNEFGQTAQNAINSAFTMKNVELAMQEAQENALKDMLTQLMQVISQTMQSSTDEMQTAQKNFESFNQMFRDFANTITQGMYRS